MIPEKINPIGEQVRTPSPAGDATRRRICRTAEEIAQAGWDAAADHPPLTPEQITRIAALIGPHIRASIAAAEARAGSAA